ncbi:putative protein JASON [Helianthus annuus]|nr:putative protein JASON [Helianthus annuus]
MKIQNRHFIQHIHQPGNSYSKKCSKIGFIYLFCFPRKSIINSISKPCVPYLSLKNTGGISSSSSEVCGIEPDSCSFSSKSSSHKITKVPLNPSEPLFNHIVSKPSPNTTPFKLTDDMQTLGTAFPPYGNNPRVKFQYMYSPMNTKKISQLDEPVQESPQSQVKLQASTKSNYEGCVDQSLVPASYGQTPGDRPILGVVTAYWNADETPFTPKWGDGNGIPNTTNKYREVRFVHYFKRIFTWLVS